MHKILLLLLSVKVKYVSFYTERLISHPYLKKKIYPTLIAFLILMFGSVIYNTNLNVELGINTRKSKVIQ